jgi:hypothetical protein
MEPAGNNNEESSNGPRWELEDQQSDIPRDNHEQREERKDELDREQQPPANIRDYANEFGL